MAGRRTPDWDRLKAMIDAGAVRRGFTDNRTGKPVYNQVGDAINKRTNVQHIIARRHAPGPELLTLLADLFGESRADWLEAGGIALDARPMESPAVIAAQRIAHNFEVYGSTGDEMDMAESILETMIRRAAAQRRQREADDVARAFPDEELG